MDNADNRAREVCPLSKYHQFMRHEGDDCTSCARIAQAIRDAVMEEQERCLSALRELTPPTSATKRDLSMWDLMMVLAMAAIRATEDSP